MVRLSNCLVILVSFLIMCSCAHTVNIYEDGKKQPNHKITLHTVDGNLSVTYFTEKYNEITVGDESMLMPSSFPPHDNIWLYDVDKKVSITLMYVNDDMKEINVVYNKINSYQGKELKESRAIYQGKLPYKEFTFNIKKEKGETTVWFDFYKKDGNLYCFTRDVKFRY